MPRKKKPHDIPREYLNLEDEEISRYKKIGDMMQSVEKGKIAKVKALEASKSVIATEIVSDIVTDVFSKLKSILYSSTNKLPAQIAGKEHAEITQIIFKFIDDSLQRASEDLDNKINNLKVNEESEDVSSND